MESFTQKEIVSQSTKHVNWLDNIPELCYCVFQLRWAGLYMYFLSLDWNMRLWDYVPFVHFFANVFCNFKFCITQITNEHVNCYQFYSLLLLALNLSNCNSCLVLIGPLWNVLIFAILSNWKTGKRSLFLNDAYSIEYMGIW